jgi:NTE family protein
MPAARRRRSPTGPQPISLALQGGGSHGAFTAGALDALLADESLVVDAVSGASAGAMNAAVLACGWARDGRAGARAALHAFWRDIGACRRPFGGFAPPGLDGFNLADNPWWAAWNAWWQLWSPYQTNPANLNPLRDVVAAHVDEALLRASPVRALVTATSVRTGQAHLFHGETLSVDALLASACLPQLFQAVVIDGEPYWDGGYTGNPPLWPLVYHADALDVVLVQLDPLVRPGIPRTAGEIADRLNEITFNAGLVAEIRAISFVQRLAAEHRLDPQRFRSLRLHRVADDAALAPLDASSKTNNDPALVETLWALGRAAGARFLATHRAQIGRASSFDLEAVFLAAR